MTKHFDMYRTEPHEFFDICRGLGADQVTLRVLYADGETDQAKWVRENAADGATIDRLRILTQYSGRELEQLEFGRTKYSIHGMGTVIDNDCMAQEAKDVYKYLILRPNCKLYSKWDDRGSLIF